MDTSVALVQAYLHVNGYSRLPSIQCWRRSAASTRGRSRISTFWHSGSPAPVTTSFAAVGAALSLVERSHRIRFLAARLIVRT